MIKKHKLFERPKDKFDLQRIKSENEIVKNFGLKNKKEIWKAKAKLDNFRRQAKKLIGADVEQQEKFLSKLKKLGFIVSNPVEVLALKEEDILGRRLQTIVAKKGFANTQKEARQLITHKKIVINGEVINKPSYLVNVDEENEIKLLKKVVKAKPVEEKKENVEGVKVKEEKPVEEAE
ncbi:30S ribosomal protein S4 [Candidatus Pacearchaeota archaeon]|nr:30S ribosomal protein S4 [Candidatus Pacearchaeota archaeon]|tara:strand:- start:2364 stop:2897 length:534 start_codon:yes stop_codon:yes gene_type:complete